MAWPNPDHWSHLGSEPRDQISLFSLSLFLLTVPFKQTNNCGPMGRLTKHPSHEPPGRHTGSGHPNPALAPQRPQPPALPAPPAAGGNGQQDLDTVWNLASVTEPLSCMTHRWKAQNRMGHMGGQCPTLLQFRGGMACRKTQPPCVLGTRLSPPSPSVLGALCSACLWAAPEKREA